MRIAPTISPNTTDTRSIDRTTRFAACLVYALAPTTDLNLHNDVAYVASELDIADELDVFEALDELCFAVETLTTAARGR